jgi:hypothetical protein
MMFELLGAAAVAVGIILYTLGVALLISITLNRIGRNS